MKEKRIILSEQFPDSTHYNSPSTYDVPTIIQWFLDGFTEIEIQSERKNSFIYFAAANGLLAINSDGFAYVVGMKIV